VKSAAVLLAVFLLFSSLLVFAQPPALPGGVASTPVGLKVQLFKGWNLVKFPSNMVGQADASTCLQSDLAASFVYDVNTRSYIEVGSQRFAQFLQSNADYLAHTAVWLEVKRDCTISVSDSFKSEGLAPVQSGWNFVAVSPDLVNGSLQDIRGTCSLSSAYLFDARKQAWAVLGVNEPLSVPVGQGILFQAGAACDLIGQAEKLKGKIVVTVSDKEGNPAADAKVAFSSAVDQPEGVRGTFIDKGAMETVIRFTNAYGRVEALFKDGKEVTFTVNKKGFKQFASPNFVAQLDSTEYANVVLEAEEAGKVFAGAPYRGNPNALVTIEVFENYVDQDSRLIQGVIDEIEAYFGEFVKIVHKDFPSDKKDITNRNLNIDYYNPLAVRAAFAARCANEQGKFWAYHRLLYRKQRITVPYTKFVEFNPESGASTGLTEEQNVYDDAEDLVSYASELGLDSTQFRACLSSERYKGVVLADLKEAFKGLTYAVETDIDAVPTLRINGTKFGGLNYFYVYKVFIEGLLLDSVYAGSPLKGAPFFSDPHERESHPDYPLKPQPVVTIVEFCDFESKECKTLNLMLNQIMDEYQKDCLGTEIKNLGQYGYRCTKFMRRLHKDYPLDIHLRSMLAAEASRCASQVTDYWKFHDELYQIQPNFYPDAFSKLLSKLEGQDFSTTYSNDLMRCVSQDRYKPDIDKDLALAKSLGVKTIPTLFINGTKVEGMPSYQTLKAIIDQKFAVKLAQPVSQAGGALVKYCQAYPNFSMCRRGTEATVLGTKTYN